MENILKIKLNSIKKQKLEKIAIMKNKTIIEIIKKDIDNLIEFYEEELKSIGLSL